MRLRAEVAVAEAARYGVKLDYSAGSASAVEALIRSWESEVRIACDLDDGAWVGDQLPALHDVTAIGAYYGELFVRHAGAVWQDAVGEDGQEAAVSRNGVTVLPITMVRNRVVDGSPLPDLTALFQGIVAKMTGGAGTA
jgi:hypothetical protein